MENDTNNNIKQNSIQKKRFEALFHQTEFIKTVVYQVYIFVLLFLNAGWLLGIPTEKNIFCFMGIFFIMSIIICNNLMIKMHISGKQLLFGGAIIFSVILIFRINNIFAFLNNYINWALNTAKYDDTFVTQYEILQIIWLVIISYIFAWMLLNKKWSWIAEIISFALLFGMQLVNMVRKETVSHLGIIMLLVYGMVILIKGIEKKWNKRRKNSADYIFWLFPIMLFYMMVIIFIPYKETPYDWKIVKTVCSSVQEKVTKLVLNATVNMKEDFDMGMTGYSKDMRFKSKLISSDMPLMTLKYTNNLVTNVYLMGDTFSQFNIDSWQKDTPVMYQNRIIDTLETLCAIKQFDPDYTQAYVKNTSIEVEYNNFHSSLYFMPLKTLSINDWNNKIDSTIDGNENKIKGYGSKYSINFFQLNIDHPVFYDLITKETKNTFSETASLSEEEKGEKEIWDSLNKKYGLAISYQQLRQYRQEMNREYTEDVQLSPEMKKWLLDVTKNEESDIEKLKAVERELSTMTYTLKPGKMPKSIKSTEDFLDYYVLEKKEGYCTHFATVFVLLARSMGYPSRLVEGFCVRKGNNEKNVSSSMAHAWPEVYFEGVGWIPFEPTPSYQEIRNTPWKVIKYQNTGISESDKIAFEERAKLKEEKEREIKKRKEQEDEILRKKEIEKRKEFFGFGLKIIFVIGILVLLGIIFAAVKSKVKYSKMSYYKKMEWESERVYKILKKAGIVRNESETLQEFSERIEKIFGYKFEMFKIWEYILYNGKEADAEDIKCVVNERLIIKKILKEKSLKEKSLKENSLKEKSLKEKH